MPTLLDIAGIDCPESVEGLSMLGSRRRDWLFGEVGEGDHATRMIRKGKFKLIYYPAGNCRQLFDLDDDPTETYDLSPSPDHREALAELTDLLIGQLHGGDEAWVRGGELVGRPERAFRPGPNRGLSSQRGHHWPPPPRTDMQQIQWHNEDED